MKRIAAISTAVLLLLSATSCQGRKPPNESAVSIDSSVIVEPTGILPESSDTAQSFTEDSGGNSTGNPSVRPSTGSGSGQKPSNSSTTSSSQIGKDDPKLWSNAALTPPGDKYDVPNIQRSGANAPVIAQLSKQVSPGSSVTVSGSGFSAAGTKAYVFAQNGSAAGKTYEASMKTVDDNTMIVTVDASLKYGIYGIYVKNANGTSNLAYVNRPLVWWVGMTAVNAGDEFSLYGENLTTGNGESTNAYLVNDEGGWRKLEVSFADPYKVTVKIPTGLADGKKYTVRLHNGHGGQQGWADATETITYYAARVNAFTGKTLNVTAYGADPANVANDDSPALQKAINAASDGDTVYFPAGTYLCKSSITVPVGIHLKGDGAKKSKIVMGSALKDTSIFKIEVGPTEISSLGFEDVSTTKQIKAGFIDYYGDMTVSESANLYIHDCRFVQGTRANMRSKYAVIQARAAASVVIENNYFEATTVMFTSSMQKLIVRNNEICGVFYCGKYYDQNTFLIWDTEMFDASNNKIYGKDLLTDNSGELSSNDFTVGRSFAIQGFNRNQYISHNTITRAGLPNDNAGEQILLEGIEDLYFGKITSATETTITAPYVKALKKNYIVTIVKGKGAGQTRHIKTAKNKSITLSKPWVIVPDKTSTIMITAGFDNYAIHANTIDGFKNHNKAYTATCGVQVYGNTHNTFITNNTFKNMVNGVCLTSHFQCDGKVEMTNGVYWTTVDNNKIEDCSVGIKFKLSHMIAQNADEIAMYTSYGVTIRGNEFKNMMDFDFDSRRTLGGVGIELGTRMYTYTNVQPTVTWNGAWENASLIENNRFINCAKHNIILCRHQGNTVLRGNQASGPVTEIVDIEKPGYAPIHMN